VFVPHMGTPLRLGRDRKHGVGPSSPRQGPFPASYEGPTRDGGSAEGSTGIPLVLLRRRYF
jgi:hypothetical protein